MSRSEKLSSPPRVAARSGAIALRPPVLADGAEIWHLVRRSGTLEENSCYAYLLLCTHFADTCVVAEKDGSLAGFVAAYVPPVKPDVIFVWQVAVDPAVRRVRLGTRLLAHLVSLPRVRSARFLEATVTPSNQASRRLFASFAAAIGVACRETDGFAPRDFAGASHEAERLLRIGPLPGHYQGNA